MSTDPLRAHEQAAVECVIRSVSGVALHEMREAPDADLLHDEGFHVGLEVVQAIDQRYYDAQKRLQAATEEVQRELESRNVCARFLVYFDLNEISSASPAQRRTMARRLADFLAARSDAMIETAELKAHEIEFVGCVERMAAPKTFVHLGWRSRVVGGTLAAICLDKKHERLRYYRDINGDRFKQYWLAIASVGPGTVEDGGFSMLMQRSFVTDFDRVFLIWRGPDGTFARAQDVTPAAGAVAEPAATSS